MSKHSPEPWELARSTKASRGESTVFAGLRSVAGAGPLSNDLKATKANAERIVACVNACAGVEDPESAVRVLRDAARTAALFINGDYEGRMPEGDVLTLLRNALAIFPKEGS
jgi:hypothetical protein